MSIPAVEQTGTDDHLKKQHRMMWTGPFSRERNCLSRKEGEVVRLHKNNGNSSGVVLCEVQLIRAVGLRAWKAAARKHAPTRDFHGKIEFSRHSSSRRWTRLAQNKELSLLPLCRIFFFSYKNNTDLLLNYRYFCMKTFHVLFPHRKFWENAVHNTLFLPTSVE